MLEIWSEITTPSEIRFCTVTTKDGANVYINYFPIYNQLVLNGVIKWL